MVAEEASHQEFPIPFGKYLLTDLIAVGGMAEVYRAKIFGASGFEKEMVVKRILPRYAKNPSFVQMLIDEAKIAVNLTHGNIVPIYELGEFEGSYYIAMEFVEGHTILDVLRFAHGKQEQIPWPMALFMCAEVAGGLAYAHSRKHKDGSPLGLVHRDINPRNIVVTVDGEVKILDFGIARASTKKHQTASGVIKGTPGYMSPEQMYGQTIDSKTDVYCLGILAHELLTLRRLFPAWTVKEMRGMYEEKPVAPPSVVAPGIPPEVDAVVMGALDPDQRKRYDAAAFEEALRTAIARSGQPVTSRIIAREVERLKRPGPPAPKRAPDVTAEIKVADVPSPTAATQEAAGAGAGAPAVSVTGPEPKTLASNPSNRLPPASGSEAAPNPPTQPMPSQTSASLPEGDEGAFVISLATDPRARAVTKVPLEPLPKSRVTTGVTAPKTHVLAQNADLEWSGQIGDDAELLAIAKAAGSAPGQTKLRLALFAAIALVVAMPLLAFAWPEISGTISRALEGKVLRNGALVVKTTPAGAEVILDGEVKGRTNIKLTGVDPDAPHQLVVKPEGRDPIITEFAPADFVDTEGLPTFIFERDFSAPAEEAGADAPPPVEEKVDAVPEKKSKKKTRRSRRK